MVTGRETRTNIVLDDALVEQAKKKAGVTTKKAAIEAALRAFVREPDWDFIAAMEGSRAVADDYTPQDAFAHDPDLAWGVAELAATWREPAGMVSPAKPATVPVAARRTGGGKPARHAGPDADTPPLAASTKAEAALRSAARKAAAQPAARPASKRGPR